MKKKTRRIVKAVGVGLSAAAVSAMLSGCNWFPIPYSVYGPPPDWEEQYRPEDDDTEDVYGPPSDWEFYDPAEDDPAPVYGPPGDDDYDPAGEEVESVYGPGPDLDEWDSDW